MKFVLRGNKAMGHKGTATLEAAIVMPIVIMAVLFFVWLFQLLCLQNCLEHATLQAAKDLKQYAVIYHEYGVVRLENKLLEQLDSDIAESFVDLRGAAQNGQDYLYATVAEALIKSYLNQDAFLRQGYLQYEALSCNGSTFFDRNEDINLQVRCKIGHVTVGTSVRFRCWIRGDSPITSITASGLSVWSFDNFTRGKIIRDIFGGTLPYDYPVIAAFEDETAIMIKSIDITKSTYQDGTKFASEVRDMIQKLSNFKGTEGNRSVEEDLWICENDIKTRKLLLVLPENPMTQTQSAALLDVLTNDAVLKHIQVEIKVYQTSGEAE